jgi:hypothetical protein
MRALSSLNLAANSLGELVPPEGWSKEYDWGDITYKHADGREQTEDPGSKPEGILALANAIPDMGALSTLDLSINRIPTTEAGMLNATCKAKGVDLAL